MNELGKVGKIIISEPLQKHIHFLHQRVGRTEWSGMLFYKHTEGEITEFKDLVFEAVDMFLMDIGSSALTEFKYDGDIVEAYDNIEEAIECGYGLIHTHHGMGAYHSGTDWEEIEKNAEKYNYYISLVVDFAGNYKCKVAFPSKSAVTYTNYIKDTNGEVHEIQTTTGTQTVLFIGDLDVEAPELPKFIPDWVEARYDAVNSKPKYNTFFGKGRTFSPNSSKATYPKTIPSENEFEEYVTPKIKKNAQIEKFVEALLTGDSDIPVSTIYSGIYNVDRYSKTKLDEYLSGVEIGLEAIHTEIFGNLIGIADHLEQAAGELSNYLHKENIDELILLLDEYAEVYEPRQV